MTMYAAEIVDGIVVQVIVGDADWASAALGGFWISSAELVGKGMLYIDGQFVESEPEPDVEVDSET